MDITEKCENFCQTLNNLNEQSKSPRKISDNLLTIIDQQQQIIDQQQQKIKEVLQIIESCSHPTEKKPTSDLSDSDIEEFTERLKKNIETVSNGGFESDTSDAYTFIDELLYHYKVTNQREKHQEITSQSLKLLELLKATNNVLLTNTIKTIDDVIKSNAICV